MGRCMAGHTFCLLLKVQPACRIDFVTAPLRGSNELKDGKGNVQTMRYPRTFLIAAVVALGFGSIGTTHASVQHQHAAAPTAPAHYTVIAGWGDNYGAA